jgi:hypothetical protein
MWRLLTSAIFLGRFWSPYTTDATSTGKKMHHLVTNLYCWVVGGLILLAVLAYFWVKLMQRSGSASRWFYSAGMVGCLVAGLILAVVLAFLWVVLYVIAPMALIGLSSS